MFKCKVLERLAGEYFKKSSCSFEWEKITQKRFFKKRRSTSLLENFEEEWLRHTEMSM